MKPSERAAAAAPPIGVRTLTCRERIARVLWFTGTTAARDAGAPSTYTHWQEMPPYVRAAWLAVAELFIDLSTTALEVRSSTDKGSGKPLPHDKG